MFCGTSEGYWHGNVHRSKFMETGQQPANCAAQQNIETAVHPNHSPVPESLGFVRRAQRDPVVSRKPAGGRCQPCGFEFPVQRTRCCTGGGELVEKLPRVEKAKSGKRRPSDTVFYVGSEPFFG